MRLFAEPRGIKEAFGLAITFLRLSGLFPFCYDDNNKEFHVSRKWLCVTIGHIVVYTYVNVTSILDNWRDYSQPMIGHSFLSVIGNLVLRLLSIAITFLIMLLPLFDRAGYVSSINAYIKVIDQLILLNIDVSTVLRRIYFLSFIITFALVGMLAFTAWHSIYFYELMTQRPPEFKYYLVVSLSFFYKTLFIFNGGMELFGIYMITNQFNSFLEDVKERHREEYQRALLMKYSWIKPNGDDCEIKNFD